MTSYRKALLVLCIIALCAIPIAVSDSITMIKFPLKPSPPSGPYQDEMFLEKANEIIYSLSNQTIPNGTNLWSLQSTQQNLAKMNISPEFHAKATQINNFLYYTGQAGAKHQSIISIIDKPYSPVYNDQNQLNEARSYYDMASRIWDRIKNDYPDVTLYTFTGVDTKKPFTITEDPDWIFDWATPVPNTFTG